MRFLGLFALVAAAAGSVSAQNHCSTNNIASPNAIRVFVSHHTVTGNFASSPLALGATNIVAADNICNQDAILGDDGENPVIPGLVTRGSQGLFKAVISNQQNDAAARFGLSFDVGQGGIPVYEGSVDPSWDVVDSLGNCIADSLADFFSCGNVYDTVFRDSVGLQITAGGNVQMWTGSSCEGLKWMKLGASNIGNVVPSTTTSPLTSQQSYCSQGTIGDPNNQGYDYSGNDPNVKGYIGVVGIGPAAEFSDWISKQAFTCSNALSLMCLQYAQPTQVTGDPQFVGLQGQSFQVHGMPDEFFNLITSPDMQLNSRFTYLASGTCNYNNTECWTHPGTYVDQLGFMFPGIHIKAIAGSHDHGMIVSINDVRLDVSAQPHTHVIKSNHNNATVVITYARHDQIVVQSPLFTITATNSDMFFNFGVVFHEHSLLSAGSAVHHISEVSSSSSPYPKYPLHGLLGQTWKNARYKHGQMYQGQVDDYMINESQLFSNKFVYNQYTH